MAWQNPGLMFSAEQQASLQKDYSQQKVRFPLGRRGIYSEWGSWVSLAVESKYYQYLKEGIVSSSISNCMQWKLGRLSYQSPVFAFILSLVTSVVDSSRPFRGSFARKKRLQFTRPDTPMVTDIGLDLSRPLWDIESPSSFLLACLKLSALEILWAALNVSIEVAVFEKTLASIQNWNFVRSYGFITISKPFPASTPNAS